MSQDPTPNDAFCEVKSINFEVVEKPERRATLGRPARLTLRRFISLCHRVESGWSIVKAAESQGVTYRALRLRVAQSPRLQERLREAEEIRFNRRAEIACESVMQAGHHSWLAHAWWLERNLPNFFALRTVNRPEQRDQQPEEPPLPSEVLEQHRRLMLELREGAR